jgi:hypothetical protein
MVNMLYKKYILLILICLMTGCNQGNNAEDIQIMAKNTSDAMNTNLPDMVSEDMLLLETNFEDMEFTYYVSVLNYSINRVNVDAFIEFMRPNLIENVCTLDRHQAFISKGIKIRYVYSDKDEQEFVSITIKPDDCGK